MQIFCFVKNKLLWIISNWVKFTGYKLASAIWLKRSLLSHYFLKKVLLFTPSPFRLNLCLASLAWGCSSTRVHTQYHYCTWYRLYCNCIYIPQSHDSWYCNTEVVCCIESSYIWTLSFLLTHARATTHMVLVRIGWSLLDAVVMLHAFYDIHTVTDTPTLLYLPFSWPV